MDKQYLLARCERYLNEETDEEMRSQIIELMNDESASGRLSLFDRMHGDLKFGTAGLRAEVQAGYERMNLVTVFRFAYALAPELSSLPNKSVALAYDGRAQSLNFAEEIDQVLRFSGIAVHRFRQAMPTPLCSYATKKLKASFGVMVTASHNPVFDNGIKLFNGDGSQAYGELLRRIEHNMQQAIKRSDFFAAAKFGVGSQWIGEEIVKAYMAEIKKTRFFPDHQFNDVRVVYTPIHGVGKELFVRACEEEHFKRVLVVPEQAEPDPSFHTVAFPNPEEEGSLDRANALASAEKCAYVLANDPDADRLQVSCLNDLGQIKKLSGNEIGVILGYFVIMRAKERGVNGVIASSIVSSRMLKNICDAMQMPYVDGLTGFSNIVARARASLHGQEQLIFAYEEAIGYLFGEVVLDKDGIHAGVRFMEIINYLQQQQKNLWQLLDELYLRFGLFVNDSWFWRADGEEGMKKIAECMAKFRMLSEQKVATILGQSECTRIDLIDEPKNSLYKGLRANVLIFEVGDWGRFLIRPSGTEPKIKFYLELFSKVTPESLAKNKTLMLNMMEQIRNRIDRVINA